jgi:hypothetical protein
MKMDSDTTHIQTDDSARALLEGIIDYAGLFPPSQVSMAEAVLNYATYRNSNYNWMLGRFVLPAARLEEFLENTGDFVPRNQQNVWRLSVLAGEDVPGTIRRIDNFNAQNSSRVLCDVLELKAFTTSEIENAVKALPDYLTAYFEVPVGKRLAELVTELAIRGQRAKIRTGGVTNDAFPTTAEIIRFIRTCLAANVPFKATAGLHHALRCFKPLTYESNAPMGAMHGFLNLFLATGFARQGFKPSLLESLLEDEFAESFEFTEGAITWHRDYILTAAQIARTRQSIVSFGSCSFDEPVADLQEMKVL